MARCGCVGCGGACQLDRPLRSTAVLKWRFGVAGGPGATCRQFRVGGGERCRVPLCAVNAWRPCPAWRGKGAHAECSGGMPQARGAGADRIRCTCMCTEFILHVFWTQRCMHPMGGQVLGFTGGRGPAFFYCTQPLVHRQCVSACCITAPFFAAPNLAPAQVGARRGSAVESRGHFLASPTWISRMWDPGGGARWGGEVPRALFVMGRRGCGGAFVAKLLGTQGSRAARWHRRLRVSECALARSGGTTAKTFPTARHPRFAQGVGGHPGCVLFNAAGGGPTSLPLLAPRRGTWSTSRCHRAAVEVVGWVVGPGLSFGARTAGEGWGPRQIRASCHTLLAGGAQIP